jgi:hypothetical protein
METSDFNDVFYYPRGLGAAYAGDPNTVDSNLSIKRESSIIFSITKDGMVATSKCKALQI